MTVTGELDIATLPEFDQALRTAEADAKHLVLDLRDLEFVSSSGGHAMVAADRRVREAGGRFMVVRGPAQVDRFFALTRIDSVLELMDERPATSPSSKRRAARFPRQGPDRHPLDRVPAPVGSGGAPPSAPPYE